MTASRTALYRFFDADGDLLYVGISVAPWARWKQHKGEKDWAEEVATSTMEWFDTRPAAMAAEKAAIIAEEPRYNVVHNGKRAVDSPLLTIVCSGCGEPIGDGQGVVECQWGLALKKREDRRAFRQRNTHNGLVSYTGGDLLDPVWVDVPWRAWHYDCDPDPESDPYWFAVERCRSLADLFDWIGHLGEKDWVSHTNWTDTIRAMNCGRGIFRLTPQHLGVQTA